MSTRLFGGNLGLDVGEDELRSHFSDIGRIVAVRIPVDRETRKPRGFAFVEYAEAEEAEEAIATLDGSELRGRRIRLQWAVEDARRQPRKAGQRRQAGAEPDDETEAQDRRGWREDEDEKRDSRPWRDRKSANRGGHGSDRVRGRGTRRVIE